MTEMECKLRENLNMKVVGRKKLFSMSKECCHFFVMHIFFCRNLLWGTSMPDHPGYDTLISQISPTLSQFVDNVEKTKPWKFQLSVTYGSRVIEV